MCGIFGFFDYSAFSDEEIKHKITRNLSVFSQIRGIDATGFAFINNGKLIIDKRSGPAFNFNFKFPDEVVCVMGHCRAASQGNKSDNKNNHPFYGYSNAEFALAHNGIIFNDVLLRKIENLPKTEIGTDSYIAVQLIEKSGKIGFEILKKMAESICGSFMISVLTQYNELYLVRGKKPVYIIHIPDSNMYLYSSTKLIMKLALRKTVLADKKYNQIKLNKGQIVRITLDGKIKYENFQYHYSMLENMSYLFEKIFTKHH